MNGKTKTTATKEDAMHALVPKLRFPEFREMDGWKNTRLGDLCDIVTKGSTPTSYGFDYAESGVRFVKIESLSGGLVDCSKTAYITEECNASFFRSQLKENDILFSIAGALGVIALVERSILPANINQAIGIIRLKRGYSHQFLLHQLQADLIQFEIQRIKAGAAQPNISLSQLGDFVAMLPTPAEQQKIAECLSSLDELMAAQARKVDALKTHKKGLMQQLFPREGETQPRLRFPEFQNAGEWEEEALGKVADFVNEKIPLTQVTLENYVSTENILPDYGGVARASKLPTTDSVTQFRANDTLVSNIRPYLKKVWCADKEGGASNDVIVIRAKSKLLPQYLSILLRNDAFISYVMEGAKGVKMPRGDIGSMREYSAYYPSKPEQQRIATCLSSLDALITAETQKHEALKTHKKGLMQQLFPTPEEVEA